MVVLQIQSMLTFNEIHYYYYNLILLSISKNYIELFVLLGGFYKIQFFLLYHARNIVHELLSSISAPLSVVHFQLNQQLPHQR